ncbi:MAG: DUF1207 domain-containing protein [Gemmatimonadales bacterium]
MKLSAQQSARLFPSRAYLPRLLADPRQPVASAKFVFVTQSADSFGSGVDGEAAIGTAIPVFIISGSSVRHSLVFGVEGGVFGKFRLEKAERDLISTDWVFSAPFVLHRGDSWYRFGYHHTSAHLGDEFAERFNVSRVNFGRDIISGLAHLQVSRGLAVYGGGGWAFNVDPNETKRFSAQTGLELERVRASAGVVPYGAVDVLLDQDRGWDPRVNIQVGLRMYQIGPGRDLRMAAEVLNGPSPEGEFFDRRTTFITFGVYVTP